MLKAHPDEVTNVQKTVAEAQSQAKAQGKHWPAHVDAWTPNFPDLTQQPSRDGSIAALRPLGADTVEYENWVSGESSG